MNLPQLNHKKIFLTGGTGFFGKSILDCLLAGALPHTEFLILSRNPEKFLTACPEFKSLKQIRFLSGDVRDFPFPDEHFDYIFHAATPAVTTLPPGEMRKIILEGTHRTLDFAKHCGAAKFLFTSSGAVYGPQPPEVPNVPEDFPCQPVTEYGIAKLEAEQMCLDSGIFTLLPRCFAFVGPRLNLDIHFAIGNFIRNGLNHEDIIIKGDGTPYRSYMYADDLVEWLFTILAKGKNGRPYNVGSPDGFSIAELAGEVAGHFSPQPNIKILGTRDPNIPPAHYVPDTSRAKNELSLDIKINLSQAIDQTIKMKSYE